MNLNTVAALGWNIHNLEHQMEGLPMYFYVALGPGKQHRLIIHGSVAVAEAEKQAKFPSAHAQSEYVDRIGFVLGVLASQQTLTSVDLKQLDAVLSDSVLNYAIRTTTWERQKSIRNFVHFLVLAEPLKHQSYDLYPVMLPVDDSTPICADKFPHIARVIANQIHSKR